ncbi:MAG: ABC transporter substrate-binding protein, partial [Solimonas sp.]
SKVTWKSAAATAKVALMLQEEADAVAIYLNARPSILARLRPGQELAWFMFGDRGANIYGDGVITTDKFVKEQRDVAQSFVQASARGYREAYADLRAGVEPICKAFPELNRDLAVHELEAMREVGIGPAQQKHGIGYVEPEKMDATYAAVVKLLGQPISRPVSDLYINLI